MKSLWTIIILQCLYGNVLCSYFDLEEQDGFHYSVNFVNHPLNEEMLKDPPPSDTISLGMRNNVGQPFHCYLPSPEALASERRVKPPALDVPPDLMKDIMELLSPLNDHPCLKRSEGYWEYELCYGQFIKQYHTQDNKPVGDIIILGNYDFDYTEKEHNKNRLLRHYSQYYINGSICDELGTPRKAEVRYVCDPATPSEIITSVEEPMLCEYVLTVKTSRTCSLPQMRPIPKSKEKLIDCFPLLTSSEFSDYMERNSKVEKKNQDEKILSTLGNDKLSDKLIDEIVSLVKSSVSDSANLENPSFTVINAQKYLDSVVDLASQNNEDDNGVDSSSTLTPPEQEEEASSSPPEKEEDAEIEEMVKEGSDLMKKLYKKYSSEDLSKIVDKIEKVSESSVDEIIKEAAEDLKIYLKPLKKAEAAQALSSSVDSLMGRLKSAIKNVDKEIQDIEKIIKDDEELLQNLEETLDESELDELDDEASTHEPSASSNHKNQRNEQNEANVPLLKESVQDGSGGKHDGKRSVKKDLSLQEEDSEGPLLNEIDLEDETRKTLDNILSSVQSKINSQMGPIKVKVESVSELDEGDELPFFFDKEDMRHYSRMMHESWRGNNKAYEDIKKFRRDRKGYLFSSSSELPSSDEKPKEEGTSSETSLSIKKGNLIKVPIRLPHSLRKELHIEPNVDKSRNEKDDSSERPFVEEDPPSKDSVKTQRLKDDL